MILARCPNGHVFPSVLGEMVHGKVLDNVIFSGNREVCPYCGTLAQTDDFYGSMADGVFQAVRRMTWSEAQAVQRAISEGEKKGAEKSDIVDAIAAVSPEFGAFAKRFKGNRAALMFVLGLSAIILAKCNITVNLDINVNDLFRDLNKPRPAASQSLDHPKGEKPDSDPDPPSGGPSEEQRKT